MLELPVTTTQDYSLFNYLRSFSWISEQEIDLILQQNGLMSFIVHPDYIKKERENRLYQQLLARLVQLREEKNLWLATPGQIDRWWRQRSKMTLVKDGDDWRIEGREANGLGLPCCGKEREPCLYGPECGCRRACPMSFIPPDLAARCTLFIRGRAGNL